MSEENLKVVITGDASGLDKTSAAAATSLKKVTQSAADFDKKARELALSANYVDRSFQGPLKSFDIFKRKAADTSDKLNVLNKSTGRANFAMISLGQGIGDLPYGFTAIANNIQQTVQGFTYLQKSAGGTKGALRELGAAFKGPTGLFVGISLVSAAATILIQKYGSLSAAVEHLAGSWSTADQAHKDLIDAIKSAEKPYSDAITSVSELQAQVDLANRGILSQSTVLKNYNKTLGTTLGTANSFVDIEKKITDNAEAYIQATFKKAVATAFFQKASDAMVKSLEDQNKTSSEITSVWGKLEAAAKSITTGTKIKSIFSPWAALNGIFKDLNKSYKKNLDDIAAGDKRLSKLTGQNAFAENVQKAKKAYEEAAAAFSKVFGGPGKPPPSGGKSISDIMAKLDEDFAGIANRAKATGLSLEQIGSAEIKALESAFDQIATKGGPGTVKVLKEIDERIKQIRKDNFLPVLSGGQAKVNIPGIASTGTPGTINPDLGPDPLHTHNAKTDAEKEKLLNDQLSNRVVIAGQLEGIFTNIFATMANGENAFQALIQSIEQLIIKLAAAAVAAAVLNALTGGGAAGFGTIFGQLSGLTIPKMATGGFVAGPTMAVIGDAPGGEWVLNQKQISAILNGSGGSGGGLPDKIELRAKGSDLVAVVSTTLARDRRRNGSAHL